MSFFSATDTLRDRSELIHCDRPGAQPVCICRSVGEAHGAASFTPAAAHNGCGDNQIKHRTEKGRRWLKQELVISRQKITGIHTGFRLEAKNVNLMVRDGSQSFTVFRKKN